MRETWRVLRRPGARVFLVALALGACGREVVLGGGARDATIAPTDGGRDAAWSADAALRCAVPGAIFCDGFEQELPGLWQMLQVTSGELARTRGPVRSGNYALHVQTPAGGGAARTYLPLDTPVLGGNLNARAFVYIRAQPLNSYVVALDLRQSAEIAAHKVSVDIIPEAALQLATTTAGLAIRSEAGTLPSERWVCIELRVRVADSGGRAEVWVEGALLLVQDDVDTLPLGGIDRFALGGDSAAANPAAQLYIDDAVLGTEPIGCE